MCAIYDPHVLLLLVYRTSPSYTCRQEPKQQAFHLCGHLPREQAVYCTSTTSSPYTPHCVPIVLRRSIRHTFSCCIAHWRRFHVDNAYIPPVESLARSYSLNCSCSDSSPNKWDHRSMTMRKPAELDSGCVSAREGMLRQMRQWCVMGKTSRRSSMDRF